MDDVPRRRQSPEVVVVTDAGRSRSEDIRYRQRMYVIKMAVRTLCLIVAIVLYAVGVPVPYLLVFIIAALILPWMSVVVANSANPDPRTRPASFYTPEPPNALGSRREPPP